MKTKKAYKIDSVKETVEEIRVDGQEDMAKIVGGYLGPVYGFNSCVFCVGKQDAPTNKGFQLLGAHRGFFVGDGLVFGIDYKTGETLDCSLSKEEIEMLIVFGENKKDPEKE